MLSSPSVLLASVSYLEPEVVASWPDIVAYVDYEENVSIVYSDPVATAEYQYPIAAASYIEAFSITNWVDVNVMAQATMPDVFTVDVISPVDKAALDFYKSISDSYSGFFDTSFIGFSKAAAADSVTMLDDTDIDVWIEKILADFQYVAEQKAISYQKGTVFDQVTELDLKAYHLTKALADVMSMPIDTTARVVHKVLADSFSFSDHITANKLYERTFAELLTSPDLYTSELIRPAQDGASVSDTESWGLVKPVSDGINLIDGMDGDLDFSFIKVISELVAPSDAKIVDFYTTKADNVSTSSSGILAMQDYCDITYFLEDYVGTSRSFT